MLEYLKEQLERSNYWLTFSESKNAALVAFNVAIIAIIGEIANSNMCLLGLSYLFIIVSIFICLTSFVPNLSKESKQSESNKKNLKVNLIYYVEIAQLDAVSYIEGLKNKYHFHMIEWEQEVCRDYAEEIIINSQIAVRKYKLFQYAVLAYLMCVILFFVNIILA